MTHQVLITSPRPSHTHPAPRLRALIILPAVLVFLIALIIRPAEAISLLRDAEIEEFLRDYSNPIFEAANLEPDAVGIHIVGDPSLNAFVARGFNMFIFTGLILESDTPNQLVGVIAHETGHMKGRHLQRSDEAAKAARAPVLLSLVLGAAAIAAGESQAGIGLIQLGRQVGRGEYLHYSRGQESAADQAALTLLEQTGHAPEGLTGFFKKLRNRQLIRNRTIDPYQITHPLAQARITALEARSAQSPHAGKKDSPEEQHRLDMIKAKIFGFLRAPRITLRQYPLDDVTQPARYARAVAFYRESNLPAALTEINALIDEEPDNPFFLELKGQMLFEHGRIREAIAPHAASSGNAPQFALLKVNHARALVATEETANLNEAVRILKSALDIEPRNAFAWTELARAHGGLGQTPLAELATAEAHYARRNIPGAVQFAQRAMGKLATGTPEWRQAQDILSSAAGSAQLHGGVPQRRRR